MRRSLSGAEVPIPVGQGVHTKKAGAKGEVYVYKYTQYFRNAAGQPRSRAVCIGKATGTAGMMFPNDSYFELFKVTPSPAVTVNVAVWDYGYAWLTHKICDDIGLTEILHGVFGAARAETLLAVAAYLISHGGVMDGMDDWQERTFLPQVPRPVTSPAASRLFASLLPEERLLFFRRWIARPHDRRTVCYDVTSVSSYADLPDVEYGHNRDREDLPQFNLGMFCDEVTGQPLYYERYNGSLTDKTNLKYVLDNAASLGLRHIHLFMDGDFWSAECLAAAAAHCEAFTVGMPLYLTEATEAVNRCRGSIETYAHELPEGRIYCMEVPATPAQVAGRVLVFYDPWQHANLCGELSEQIARLENELKKCRRFPHSRYAQFSRYFKLTPHQDDPGFDYAVDLEKIEALRRDKGFFLLFTNDAHTPAETVLRHYRAKDADEKLFAQIKVEMEGNRMRTQSAPTTDGKTFATFLACVLRAHMLVKLRQYLQGTSASLNKVLRQLANIIVIDSGQGKRLVKALTKRQREVLQQFDACEALMGGLI